MALIARYGDTLGLKESDVKQTPSADYLYRFTVLEHRWAAALDRIVADVDYDNFKDSVYDRHSPERARVYSKVWCDMLAVQIEEENNAMEALNKEAPPTYYDNNNETLLNTSRGEY